MKNRAKTVRS